MSRKTRVLWTAFPDSRDTRILNLLKEIQTRKGVELHKKLNGLFMSALSLCLLAIPGVRNLPAQAGTATISGTVTDPTGAAIAGAAIQVKNVGTGVAQSTKTDAQGRYRVPELLIGSYQVQASQAGFQTTVHGGLTLTVGSQPVVDFALPVGQQQQQVNVTGEVSQVDTTSASVSSLVDQAQMRDLPLNGRNFEQLLSLSPGVTQAATGTSGFYGNGQNYSIAGSRAEGQAILLDNTDVQGFWNHGTGSAAIGSSLGVEAIAEFEVLTNTYSAQFGGSGSVINAATKSGTNTYHGSAYDFIRNSALDARNFFDDASRKPEFRQNQFGGSLGGPVKKDKLFFFVNYEGLRNALGQTGYAYVPDAGIHNGMVPNGSGGFTNVGISPLTAPILSLYPLPNGPEVIRNGQQTGVGVYNSIANRIQNENYVLGRGDYVISNKDSVFFRYVSDRANQISPFSGGQLPLWPEGDNSANQYFTTEYRRIVSSSLVNLLRFSFVRTNETASVTGNTPAINFFPGTGREDGTVAIGGGISSIGANTLIPYGLVQNKFTYADDVVWSHGSHTVKIGMGIERVQSNIFAPFIIGGQYSFSNLTTFLQGTPSSFLGVAPDHGDATRDFREIDLTPYIQDDWKITSRLTLNLGLRWEYVTNPVGVLHPLNTIVNPGPDATGFTTVSHAFQNNPNAKNLDPRFGFAYDPFKDHKTSVRGGFGVFHDPIAPREYASDYYLAPPFSFGFQVAPPFPNPYPKYVPGKTATGPVSILEGVDYRIGAAPYVMQYNLNIQREVFANTVASIGYVGSRGVHLTQQIDQNPPIPTIGADGHQVFGTIGPAGVPVPNQRINPLFGYINNGVTSGNSEYNSLQASLNRRLARNVTAQVSYTWSKCLDDDSGSFGLEGAANVVNPYNASTDRGRCNFDAEQNLRINALVSLPFHGNRAVSGWQLSGILSAASGSPFTVTDGFDQAGLQNAIPRPNFVSGCKVMVQTVSEWYNPNCFALQPVGELGNLGRNTFSAPGLVNLDMAILKETKIRENINTQFRAEFFNMLNHPNFLGPNAANFVAAPFTGGGTVNPVAGQISATVPNNQREIQFALKVIF